MGNMKKLIVFILTLLLVLPLTVKAIAPDILDLSASYANGKVTVKGTTTQNIIAVAVVLKDSDGNDLRMVTDEVLDNNTFNTEINIANLEVGSTYKVRVSNFEGGNFYETAFTVEENPNTNDKIIYSFVIGGLSVVGIATCIYFLKKRATN